MRIFPHAIFQNLEINAKTEIPQGITEEKTPPLFFTLSPEDEYLYIISHFLKIADPFGTIKEEYAKGFQLPPLNKETLREIRRLVDEPFRVIGKRPGCPLDIPLTLREIFVWEKRRAKELGIDHPELIKFYGGSLSSILPSNYIEEVFQLFFEQFETHLKKIEKSDGKSLITPHMYQLGNFREKADQDYFITPNPSTSEACSELVEALIDLFEQKLDKTYLDWGKISFYLQKLRIKAYSISKNEYLKLELTDHEKLFPEHPEFFRTLLKVDAFINAHLVKCDFPSNHFFFCSLGDGKGKKFDFIFPTKLSRSYIFPSHSLSVFLDPLLYSTSPLLVPFGVEENPFQFFSDNNANLITTQESKSSQNADWERLILLSSKGARCLKPGTEENYLNTVIENAKSQEVDLGSFIAKKLKRLAHEHCEESLDLILALIFRASSSLLLKGKVYSRQIQKIWEEMFSYIDTLPALKTEFPLLRTLLEILRNKGISFEDIYAQMQISCYLSANLPVEDEALANVIPTNAESPQLRLKLGPAIFWLSLTPDHALDHLEKLEDPIAYDSLSKLHAELQRYISFHGKIESFLKPYADHPGVRWKKVREKAFTLFFKSHPFLHQMGYLALLSCTVQKFDGEIFNTLFKELFVSLQTRWITPLLVLGCKGTPLEKYFDEGSQILAACKKISQRGCFLLKVVELLIDTKDILLIQLAIQIYRENQEEVSVSQAQKFLFKTIPLLLKIYPGVALNLAVLANEKLSFCLNKKWMLWIPIFKHFREMLGIDRGLTDEMIALLQESSLMDLKKMEGEQLVEIEKIVRGNIDQLLKRNELEKSYRLLSLSTSRGVLGTLSQDVLLWSKLLECFLDNSCTADAFHCWEEGQVHKIWNFLESAKKEPLFEKFYQSLIDSQKNKKFPEKEKFFNELVLKENSPNSLDFKLQVASNFICSIQEKLKGIKHFSDCEKILYSLRSYTKKYPPLEQERALWPQLFEQMFLIDEKFPLSKREIDIFERSLHDLFIERAIDDYAKEALLRVLHKSRVNSKLIAVFFAESLNDLYKNASGYSTDCLKSFLTSFCRILANSFSFDPVPVALKKLFESSYLEGLLEELQKRKMDTEIISLIAKLKDLNIAFSGEKLWMNSLKIHLQTLNDKIPSQKELREVKLLLLSLEKESSRLLYPPFIQLLIKAERFLEAKLWLEKTAPTDDIAQLALTNASQLIKRGQTSHAIELLRSFSNALASTPSSMLAALVETCRDKLDPRTFAKILIENILFSDLLKDTIESTLLKLLIDFRQQRDLEESMGVEENLFLALQLMGKFPVGKHLFLDTILLSISHSRKTQVGAFHFLFQKLEPKNRLDLSPKTLAICWNMLLREMEEVEDKKLIDLISNPHFMPLFNRDEAKRLQENTFQRIIYLSLKGKRKKSTLIEIAKRIPTEMPRFTSQKMEDRLDFVDFLLLGKKSERSLDTLVSLIEEDLKESLKPVVGRQIADLYDNAKPNLEEPENILDNKRIQLLHLLMKHLDIPFSRLSILNYLSKFPKVYLPEKIFYLENLFTCSEEKRYESALKQIFLEIIDDYYAISSARALLGNRKITYYLNRSVVLSLHEEASLNKIPPFFRRMMAEEDLEREKKLDSFGKLLFKQYVTGSKHKRKIQAIEKELNKEFYDLAISAKRDCCLFLKAKLVQLVVLSIFSTIGFFYCLKLLDSLEH